MVVPFMSLVFGYNPVSITFDFVLASTLYFIALQAIQNYCTSWSHLKLMWCVTLTSFGIRLLDALLTVILPQQPVPIS
jgi:hypothetical protein